MPRPNDLGCLSPTDWDRLEELADRFEEAWRDADQVDLTAFLPPAEDPLRRAALEELIKSDLEIRCARGQTVNLQLYAERFPELGGARSLSPRLLYEEYRVRQRYGDRPPLETYRERFPDQFIELKRLVVAEPVTPAILNSTPANATPPISVPPMVVSSGNVLAVGGGYRMIKRIGRGSFGEVWQAEAPGGIAVAIKLILRTVDDEEGKRERQALEVIKRLSHPFLLQTQAFWVLEDRLVIVMELADGSLRDELNQCRRNGQPGIPSADLVRYFREAADALDYLHNERVLHRDIKPDNILVRNRRVRVADFGLVREQNQHLLTVSSSGTPAYMAPEVWRGRTVLHSDQYALACTYAELRLGCRPFTDADYAGLMLSHLQGRPDLGSLPEPEQQVLLRALAKDPADRFPTCSELVRALEEVLADEVGRRTQHGNRPPPAGGPGLVQRAALASVPNGGQAAVSESQALLPTIADPLVPPPPAPATSPRRSGVEPADRLATTARTAPLEAPGERRRPRTLLAAAVLAGVLVALAGSVAAYVVFTHRDGLNHATEPGTATTSPTATTATTGTLPAVTDYLPPHCEPVPKAEVVRDLDGRSYYDRIQRRLVADQPPVVFVLLPRKFADDPPTFYLMENKVWNGLYASSPSPGATWSKGGQKDGQDAGNDAGLPVLRLTRPEAEGAARWLDGHLPTREQLDRAARFTHRAGDRTGPARGPNVAVRRQKEGPRAVHDNTDDISPEGLRDLSGNGQEWTSDTIEAGEVKVAVLRGRSYLAPGPLLYTDLEDQQKEPLTQYPERASPYTGFRVALDVPAK